MDIIVNKSSLKGSVTLPLSKSILHRCLIALFLSNSNTYIDNQSVDINTTYNGLLELLSNKNEITVNCNDSGSTLRFLIPLGIVLGKKVTYIGSPSLSKRPLDEYIKIFDENSIEYTDTKLPMTISGEFKNTEYKLDLGKSSQFLTGLLFAFPLLKFDTVITVENMTSKPYIDLTIDVLAKFGIKFTYTDERYHVDGNQQYVDTEYKIERDYSQSAFFLAAGAINGQVTIKDMVLNSLQGDKKIVDVLMHMNANIACVGSTIIATSSDLKSTEVDIKDCPDLGPILMILGLASKGTMVIRNTKRLIYKESSRINNMAYELTKLGANIAIFDNHVEIYDSILKVNDVSLDTYNDHRLAMAFTVLSLILDDPLTIKNVECIDKSYPKFLEDYENIGGNICYKN